MKVLYVGVNYGSSLDRLNLMRQIDPQTAFLEIDPYISTPSAWQNRIERLVFFGPKFRALNREVIAQAERLGSDVVWIDKGFWIHPSTLRTLRAQGVFTVHHFTDAYFPRRLRPYWEFMMLRKALPLFDFHFTANIDDHAWMLRQGMRAELTGLGYNHTMFDNRPLSPDLREKWASDLLFIGHHEPRTERGIQALIDAGLNVQVYGASWHNARNKDRLGGHVHFRMLSDEEYVTAIKAARIALSFFSEVNYNRVAGRSFEITACETFLLAMRSPEHMQCFEEGREAAFFSDPDELVRKASYYLEHEDERREIARRGYERCMRDDHSWEKYLREDFAKVMQAMNRSAVCQAS
jgi:spore maturation protein CgeB